MARRWLLGCCTLLGAARSAIASASGGEHGNVLKDSCSTECLGNITEQKCNSVHHATGHHDSLGNGGIVELECSYPGHDYKAQMCSVHHECTTCTHYNCLFCSDDEESPHYKEPLGEKYLFLSGSLLLGACVSSLIDSLPREVFHPPFTVVMFCLGAFLAYLAQHNYLGCALSDSINSWKYQDPHSILFALLPPLLFESAFNVDYHVFKKVIRPSIILATTGVMVSTGLTGIVAMWLFGDQLGRIQYENPLCSAYGTGDCNLYADGSDQQAACLKQDFTSAVGYGSVRDTDTGLCLDNVEDGRRRLAGGGTGLGCYDCSVDAWWASWMFGAVVSATDPVAVVAVLQTLGAQPKLGHMIEGESLLNDGSAVVIFMVFRGLLLHEIQEGGAAVTASKMIALVARLAGGGVVIGWIFGQVVYVWLHLTRNLDSSIEISIMVLSVYMVFYISEHVFGSSGVLATVVYGLQLAKKRHFALTVETDERNEVVWEEIGYVANSFTFVLAGLIFWRIVSNMSNGDTRFDRGEQFGFAVALYFVLAVVRLVAIAIHYHLMRACTTRGYQVQWKEVIFMTYAGLRGAVSLCVALFVDHMDGVPQLVKDIVIFHTCLCVFFTIFFNGMTAGWVYKCLRLGRQGSVRGEVDAGSVKLLGEALENELDRLAGHWFHGEHNTTADGFECAKKLLKFQLMRDPDTHTELPPISDKGKLTIEPLDVSEVWWNDMTKEARSQWRADPLHNIDKTAGRGEHSDATLHKQMVQEKRKWCYTPDEAELEAEEADDDFLGAVVALSGHARSDEDEITAKGAVKEVLTALGVTELEKMGKFATRKLGIDRLAMRLPHFSKTLSPLKKTSNYALQSSMHMTEDDIETDMYSIYLTAIRASYEEEHEEGKISASAFSHLCAANSQGLDNIMSSSTGNGASVTGSILLAHQDLKAHVNAMKLSSYKISPPIHKLQTVIEAFFVEFEVHESVEKYLAKHLGGELTANASEIHERICKECREVAEDSLEILAEYAYAQHTLMPVVHSFLVCRCATSFLLAELKALKAHGLMSGACYNELTGELSKRAQDLHAVISDDGAASKMMEWRDWLGVRFCNQANKDQTDDLTPEQVATGAEVHKAAFTDMDADHSGDLNATELKVALAQLGEVLTEEEVQGIIKQADQNDDGVIDFKEFMQLTANAPSAKCTTLAQQKYLRQKHREAAAAVQSARRATAAESLGRVRMAEDARRSPGDSLP